MPTRMSELGKWAVGVIAAPLLDAAFWLFDKWDQWEIERWRKNDLH